MIKTYYNEIDHKAAAWLRELIRAGLIADGDVDERSICDVEAKDLEDYTQCHFFAGIGGWSYALRLSGWPDDRPVWTGSCPCQPFSIAGKGKGIEDKRHLWPEFRRLIAKREPSVCFGEQVASPAGRKWLSGVRANLEALGYAVGCADLCAAGVGAPHIRQRLWWVADAKHDGSHREEGAEAIAGGDEQGCGLSVGDGDACRVSDSDRFGRYRSKTTGREEGITVEGLREIKRVGNATSDDERRNSLSGTYRERESNRGSSWSDFDAADFQDGKKRRIEPGLSALVDGLPGRVGLLRGYGNAIVPQVAAEFIGAYMSLLKSAQRKKF